MALLHRKLPQGVNVHTGRGSQYGSILIYEDAEKAVEVRLDEGRETVWLIQRQMSAPFDKGIRAINEHVLNVYDEGELVREPTIRKFRVVRQEGSRQVDRGLYPRSRRDGHPAYLRSFAFPEPLVATRIARMSSRGQPRRRDQQARRIRLEYIGKPWRVFLGANWARTPQSLGVFAPNRVTSRSWFVSGQKLIPMPMV